MKQNFIEIAKRNFVNVIYDLSAVLRCMDEAYNQAIDDCITKLEPLESDLIADELRKLKK